MHFKTVPVNRGSREKSRKGGRNREVQEADTEVRKQCSSVNRGGTLITGRRPSGLRKPWPVRWCSWQGRLCHVLMKIRKIRKLIFSLSYAVGTLIGTFTFIIFNYHSKVL